MTSETRRRWVPLESNPDAFRDFATRVGLRVDNLDFAESPFLLEPDATVEAVILCFPLRDDFDATRAQTDQQVKDIPQPHINEKSVFFMKQTIGNACGTMALIHSIYNISQRFDNDSILGRFLQDAQDKTPQDRAKLFETFEGFSEAHNSAAHVASSQTSGEHHMHTRDHFVAFVPIKDAQDPQKRRIVEFDGRRGGPLDLGVELAQGDNFMEKVSAIVEQEYTAKLGDDGWKLAMIIISEKNSEGNLADYQGVPTSTKEIDPDAELQLAIAASLEEAKGSH